jgi:hypothetical protein
MTRRNTQRFTLSSSHWDAERQTITVVLEHAGSVTRDTELKVKVGGAGGKYVCGHNLQALAAKAIDGASRAHFAAQTCQKSFKSTSSLLMHRKVLHGLQPYVCEHGCGKVLLDGSNYDKHVAVCELNDERSKDHTCSYCGKDFARSDNKLRHERMCKAAPGQPEPSGASSEDRDEEASIHAAASLPAAQYQQQAAFLAAAPVPVPAPPRVEKAPAWFLEEAPWPQQAWTAGIGSNFAGVGTPAGYNIAQQFQAPLDGVWNSPDLGFAPNLGFVPSNGFVPNDGFVPDEGFVPDFGIAPNFGYVPNAGLAPPVAPAVGSSGHWLPPVNGGNGTTTATPAFSSLDGQTGSQAGPSDEAKYRDIFNQFIDRNACL